MSASRTKARLRAVEVLFEAEQSKDEINEVLARRHKHTVAQISAYAEDIIRGVRDHDDEIREYIETYSRNWSWDRMPAVDRTVLRVGTWELLYNDDVPDAVAISEAVGIARVLSGSPESPKFVNGVLDKLRQVKPTLLA
ncbi:MAG: transcription antitermination factor NusB [Rothia sp. (in: high G+C Gram-positive bacteria)]|uniref:transcription antitermination factor NusB n=1 Tax=Rothia sp. (in: high G+C Gram-positive bacteria) TaxID=1885016 RepID=UPI0026DFA35E|nr:transcription antitermination factor NusB [Rothia sp. (in: high G+C Gram-positive bacteria)]MDO5750900.1 transcription antitermination factor NusB [Rothia sp. (in: high G+C Gram-positive bacteria)]